MYEDILMALRGFQRNRRFALPAVLVLGVGIGAAATVFTAVDSVLLRPLPYSQPDRLATVVRYQGRSISDAQNGITFRFIRNNQRSFSALAASVGSSGANLVADGQTAYVRTGSVTSEYFKVFGFEPALGRTFAKEEEAPGSSSVGIISYSLWERLFAARSDAVGREIRLMGQPYTIIGVMPSDFHTFFPIELWTPLKFNDPRGIGTNYSVIGRLSDNVMPAQADAEMAALTQALLQENPRNLPRQTTLGVRPLHQMLNSGVGASVMLLFAAVSAMLLIVCANIASLMLVRALNRQREFAVRAAIGASRWRIVRQVLIESLVLSAIGSILGLELAHWGIVALVTLDPGTYLPWSPAIDIRVVAAVVAATLILGVAVGLIPAFQSSRNDIRARLMEEGRQSASYRLTIWRRILVTGEVAACLILLSAAGLLIRSFIKLQDVPLGFDGNNVLTAQMSLQGSRYDREGRTGPFVEESLSRIRALPGVEAAAVASNLPAQRGLNVTYRSAEGGLAAPDWRYITPDYFKVFRIPLRQGRYLDEGDRAAAPAVAVINEEFAREFIKTRDPLGAALTFLAGNTASSFTVVGVIGDMKSGDFKVAAAPTVFVTLDQSPLAMLATAHQYYPVNFVIRTARGETAGVAASLKRIVSSVEPNLPLASIQSMDEVIGAAVRGQRSQAALFAVFGALALITAASGIYGLISYSVAGRTREFGIRMALGATYSDVVTSVLRQGLVLASIGNLIGLAGGLFSSSLLRRYLFGVTARDPWTFAIAALILVLVAGAASSVPALRVLKLSPTAALRDAA